MNGATHRAEAGLEMLFHQFGNAVGGGQVVGIHHHVQLDEHPLAQHATAGDVVHVEHAGHGHGHFMDRFRRNGDLVHQPGEVAGEHVPTGSQQQNAQRHGYCHIEPADPKREHAGQAHQHHHRGPDIARGVLGISQQQLAAQPTAFAALVAREQQIAAQHDQQQQQILEIQPQGR